MPIHRSNSPDRVRARSAVPLSAAALRTVVRRLGLVAIKAHEVLMSRLIEEGQVAMAEALNDAFKPLADALIHFELPEQLELFEEDDHGAA